MRYESTLDDLDSDAALCCRLESDLLGTLAVPHDAYYGIHTVRAVDNYRISGRTIGEQKHLVRAYAHVKWACALANAQEGRLDPSVAGAIALACEEIADGRLRQSFVVDPIQGGAGTSTNMNFNEVIANRALERLGRSRGDYGVVHPIEHVNRSQSTNDTYPTALRVALLYATEGLLDAIATLAAAFEERATALKHVVKIGRTQLQDAVPMSLGDELGAIGAMLRRDLIRLEQARASLHVVNLGGTAIGTGVLATERYRRAAVRELARLTSLPLVAAENLVEATQDAGDFLSLSGTLKRIACGVSKACSDLRLLTSGPQAGFGDIVLPARAAGSSAMPGKVNPVIPEMVNQVAFKVVGADATVTLACESGQLQINAFLPVVSDALLDAVAQLTAAMATLARHCITGITANEELLRARVKDSTTIATLLSDYVGYEEAVRIVKRAQTARSSVQHAAVEAGLFTVEQLGAIVAGGGRPDTARR